MSPSSLLRSTRNLILCAAAALLAGCGSGLVVRVDRVIDPAATAAGPSATAQPTVSLGTDSRYGTAVTQMDSLLTRYIDRLTDVEVLADRIDKESTRLLNAREQIPSKRPRGNAGNPTDNNLNDPAYRQMLDWAPSYTPQRGSARSDDIGRAAKSLKQDLEPLRQQANLAKVALGRCWDPKPTISILKRDVLLAVLNGQNTIADATTLRGYEDKARQLRMAADAHRALIAEIQRIEAAFDVLITQAQAVQAAGPAAQIIGFGGFRSRGIYEIDPSDPMYARLLRAETIHLAKSPFTSVEQSTTGESVSMIVVESPGQVRIHQISDDPTQVIINVSLILQKAVTAALQAAMAAI